MGPIDSNADFATLLAELQIPEQIQTWIKQDEDLETISDLTFAFLHGVDGDALLSKIPHQIWADLGVDPALAGTSVTESVAAMNATFTKNVPAELLTRLCAMCRGSSGCRQSYLCLHELLLLPRPKSAGPAAAKGAGKNSLQNAGKKNLGKTSAASPDLCSFIIIDGQRHNLCQRFQQNRCTSTSCKYKHVRPKLEASHAARPIQLLIMGTAVDYSSLLITLGW
eukprot:s1033_g21.t1